MLCILQLSKGYLIFHYNVQNNIDTVNNSVTGLSASTVTIQGVANSAIQTASIVDGNSCKVSVNKEGTELQFDFRNLVVDCGDF